MFAPHYTLPASGLVVLNLVLSVDAQITYRERATSPARIIAGVVVGGVALIFFICAFLAFSRRRRAGRTFQLASIPRPHAGEQPYLGPQYYGQPGSPPIFNANGQYVQPQGGYAPWQGQYPQGQPSYPSQQAPYPPQQPQYGEKPQDDQLPAYTREKQPEQPEVGSQPTPQANNPVQAPPPIHSVNTNEQPFVGGFRTPQNS